MSYIDHGFFQAEDGIRDFCLSRGLGDVYKRQGELVINEFLGERSILEIKSGETSFKVLTDPQKNIKKGDTLKIFYKKENVMIFHPETEDLI